MKKRIIIISSIIILALVIIGIYSTFASDETTVSNNTYDFVLSENNSEITVPASSSKTVIYKVTNTNRGMVRYGVAYLGNNISVKVYDDSSDEITGYIDYGETKFIKLYIENTSNIDSNVNIKTVLGYENGGELEGTPAIPSDYILVTEEYISPKNLVTYIKNLYNLSSKTVVTNNNINYNYAQEVSLMNDRLGGTTEDYNAGNIRYYGENPNNYIDIGDYYKENTVINNMEKNEFLMNKAKISSEESCRNFFDCDTNYSALATLSGGSFTDIVGCKKVFDYESTDEICGTETKQMNEPVLYRIIGVFKDIELADGSKKDLIKITRNDSIGNFARDLSNADGTGYDNTWHDATINNVLNNGYLTSSSNITHHYYNLLTRVPTTEIIDFTKIGIKSLQEKIAKVVWNIGGHSVDAYVNQIYNYERENSKCSSCTYETTWSGKIALAYLSDHGYSADLSSCKVSLSNYIDCNSVNWMTSMSNGTALEWLINPRSNNSTSAWSIYFGRADRGTGDVYWGVGVRPTFYLEASLEIISGNGTKDNPYVVK